MLKTNVPDNVKKALTCGHPIVNDIASKLDRYGSISDKQVDLVLRLAAQKANSKPCPVGKTTLTGRVVSVKAYEDTAAMRYSYRTIYRYKMLIDCDGYRVFGSLPRNLDVKPGDYVTLCATVTASDTDASFGFYKFPTKAVVIAEAINNAA